MGKRRKELDLIEASGDYVRTKGKRRKELD
jgi:hypothetical protein